MKRIVVEYVRALPWAVKIKKSKPRAPVTRPAVRRPVRGLEMVVAL